jgi:thioredoxin reductase (NADPH)
MSTPCEVMGLSERGGHLVVNLSDGTEIAGRAVVAATGAHYRRLDVPELRRFEGTGVFYAATEIEGRMVAGEPVAVVGGGNSAVEAALELYRAGARVTLVHFGPTFDRNIKPWVLPDISNRISEGAIRACWNARVTAIEPETVVVQTPTGEERLPAEQVYLMIGYLPETGLLESLGVAIDPETGVPAHDPATMETTVPGVFIAGVLASGYDANRTFIENGRGHGELIVRKLLAAQQD